VGNGFIESRTGFTAAHFGIDDRLLLRCARAGLSLRCAGADWCEPALVTVAEKPDAAAVARKAPAFDAVGGEGKNGRVEAINGVSSDAVEEPVPVAQPFAPLDQSLHLWIRAWCMWIERQVEVRYNISISGSQYSGPVWQGSGSSKNGSGSGSSDGAAFLMELKPF
jgi:hypothetical protein